MNWEKFVNAIWQNLITVILFMGLNSFTEKHPHFGLNEVVMSVGALTSMIFGTLGMNELVRCGHTKIHRVYKICLFILMLSVFSLIFCFRTLMIQVIWIWVSIFWVTITVPFPLALYLNHKQKNSTTQPLIDDTSPDDLSSQTANASEFKESL